MPSSAFMVRANWAAPSNVFIPSASGNDLGIFVLTKSNNSSASAFFFLLFCVRANTAFATMPVLGSSGDIWSSSSGVTQFAYNLNRYKSPRSLAKLTIGLKSPGIPLSPHKQASAAQLCSLL
ncbi:hypothetical protein BU23DRAFT_40742 [Bimuria novae-zelandiae CBS 107.79]|uniref:Uncharacterized protein n=1 Tax=Bimuria novae-zelandiae CBS 107.79 TaxID=1447943 RepID=A0A6A5UJZ5_9PLEO|nr:hypothetical protein BU23DRAFT_40742 [Bimuria novae-zelandiae CBS 107.79]